VWWSREFAHAKDEVIRAKEAQIALLRDEIRQLHELNPAKLREYHQIVKQGLEEYNNQLKARLDEKDRELREAKALVPGEHQAVVEATNALRIQSEHVAHLVHDLDRYDELMTAAFAALRKAGARSITLTEDNLDGDLVFDWADGEQHPSTDTPPP
jgi:hypothetical protein